MMEQQEIILIVDDEISIRKLLVRKLSQEGYQCEEADSVDNALNILKSTPVKLAILDIKMPVKSGTDLLPIIKNEYPHTSVIMATAVTDTNIAIHCMKDGADDYVFKPFNLNEVSLSVLRTLDKRDLQLRIEEYQKHLEEKVGEQKKEIRNIFLGAIKSLIFALEAKDKYTAGHSRRVTDISVAIGKDFGISNEGIENLRWASLLHDVGKIAVNQLIQNKPCKLTSEEYEHIMIHASIGAGIVRPVVNDQVVEMIEHHHDHYDGSGLHQTISGKDIPLGARILAVADAFDAMTSDRPYRSAMSVDDAVKEVEKCVGTQFDAEIVNIFLASTINKIVPVIA